MLTKIKTELKKRKKGRKKRRKEGRKKEKYRLVCQLKKFKNSQQNTRKLNLLTYEKGDSPWTILLYSRNSGVFQHT